MSTVRHASKAAIVIVLDPKAKTAKAYGTNDSGGLDTLPGVSESEEEKTGADYAASSLQNASSVNAKNAVKGATQEDLQDLARRTGDTSVYLYYYRSIGFTRTLMAFLIIAVFIFASNFPRFWLQWYTDDPIPRFAVFIGVYVMLVLVASLSQGAMIW